MAARESRLAREIPALREKSHTTNSEDVVALATDLAPEPSAKIIEQAPLV